jgi:hypothetical protein
MTVMTQMADLKALERQAFSRFYEDGLLDILFGLTMVTVSLGAIVQDRLDSELASVAAMSAAAFVLVCVFTVLRVRLVRPRLGDFRPRPERRRRITATRMVLLGSFVVGVIAFGVVGVIGGKGVSPTAVEVLVPVLWLVNATVVMGLTAWLLGVPRWYLYGVLFGLVGPLLIWPDVLWDVRLPPPLVFGIAAAPMLVIGAWKLVRFLRTYPVHAIPDSEADLGDR